MRITSSRWFRVALVPLLFFGCGGRSILGTEEDSGDFYIPDGDSDFGDGDFGDGDFGDGDFGDGDFGDGDGDFPGAGGNPFPTGGRGGVGGAFPSGGAPSGGGGAGGGGGTGGGFPGCLFDGQCASPDSCVVGYCGPNGMCEYFLRDQDEDGYVDALCGGFDCNDLNPLAHPGRAEICTDGTDNNCNGVSDCFDPACQGGPCGCIPAPGGEDCQNGVDDDCDEASDCNDPDCIGTMSCGCTVELCENGSDDDCDGQIDCADPNCAQNSACVCQATSESCTNGADEDCDGRIDCADPSCVFHSACLCLIPQAENCGDNRDNDCNGLVDCGDPVCFSSAQCSSCETEICSGGLDDDCDGLVDCSDPSCAFDDACPVQAEQCNNDIDDDFDGEVDCDDLDCKNTQICVEMQNTCETARLIEPLASGSYFGNTAGQSSNFKGTCGGDAGEAVFKLVLTEPTSVQMDTIGTSFDSVLYVRRGSCSFGAEIGCNDDGGFQSAALTFPLLAPGTYYIFVDGFTVSASGNPDDGPYTLNVDVGPIPEDCDDGFDNDGNWLTDCADPGCANFGACQNCNGGGAPVAEYGPGLCTDGLDNDCDGTTDCLDEDCSASTLNTPECCNGFDQNGNGIADDFNCRCGSNSDCVSGQLCYTSTVHTCGIPCDNFVGEICPFLAPGSSCNLTTRQCEF